MADKLKITNYAVFNENNRKYHRNVNYNLHCHGYQFLNEQELDEGERSRPIVEGVAKHYQGRCTEFVYYRTTDAWGCPLLFIYGKLASPTLHKGE